MLVILLVYLLLIAIWVLGVAVAVYHVFKYRMPIDMTTRALEIFLATAAVVFLLVVFVVSGLSWESIL